MLSGKESESSDFLLSSVRDVDDLFGPEEFGVFKPSDLLEDAQANKLFHVFLGGLVAGATYI